MAIDGQWEGYYEEESPAKGRVRFAISATLATTARQLTGTMRDATTTFDVRFRDLPLPRYAFLYPRSNRTFKQLLEEYPDLSSRTVLPEYSDLRGRIDRDCFEFVKTYRGPQTSSWIGTDFDEMTEVFENHRVWYEGVLSADSNVLTGTWKICRPGLFGRLLKPLGSGLFFLERVADAAGVGARGEPLPALSARAEFPEVE